MRGGYHSRAIIGQLGLRLVNPLGTEVHMAVSPKHILEKPREPRMIGRGCNVQLIMVQTLQGVTVLGTHTNEGAL